MAQSEITYRTEPPVRGPFGTDRLQKSDNEYASEKDTPAENHSEPDPKESRNHRSYFFLYNAGWVWKRHMDVTRPLSGEARRVPPDIMVRVIAGYLAR